MVFNKKRELTSGDQSSDPSGCWTKSSSIILLCVWWLCERYIGRPMIETSFFFVGLCVSPATFFLISFHLKLTATKNLRNPLDVQEDEQHTSTLLKQRHTKRPTVSTALTCIERNASRKRPVLDGTCLTDCNYLGINYLPIH